MKPHRGTLVMVLGILSIPFSLCCALLGLILGIVAMVMANSDLREMDAGTMDPTGRGSTNVGRICGIIGIVLGVLNVIVGIILVATGNLGQR